MASKELNAASARASDTAMVLSPRLLEDTVVIVTGGGTGIGLAVARNVIRCGGAVAICGRRAQPLAQAFKELCTLASEQQGFAQRSARYQRPEVVGENFEKEQKGGGSSSGKESSVGGGEEGAADTAAAVLWRTCDIRDVQSCSRFCSAVLRQFGRIDAVCNNAGGQFPILAEFLSSKGFAAVVRNNLFGTWNMTSAAARTTVAIGDDGPALEGMLAAGRGGRIVNIIAQVVRGFPGMIHTGAARAGVDNLTKTLAVEWAPYQIKVNAVAPGIVISPGTDQYGTETTDKAARVTPLKRAATPEEIALLVTFLLAERASSFITGQTYYIDGGQSLAGDLFIAGDIVSELEEGTEEEKAEKRAEMAELRAKL